MLRTVNVVNSIKKMESYDDYVTLTTKKINVANF